MVFSMRCELSSGKFFKGKHSNGVGVSHTPPASAAGHGLYPSLLYLSDGLYFLSVNKLEPSSKDLDSLQSQNICNNRLCVLHLLFEICRISVLLVFLCITCWVLSSKL